MGKFDEFLGLEHPESSHSFLTQRVEELMGKFDADGDGKLSRSEYLLDPYMDFSTKELQERGKEFSTVLDKNGDGIADKNPHWAKDEARSLLKQADRNNDKMVSMDEVFARADMFLMSKMVSADLSFHGEF